MARRDLGRARHGSTAWTLLHRLLLAIDARVVRRRCDEPVVDRAAYCLRAAGKNPAAGIMDQPREWRRADRLGRLDGERGVGVSDVPRGRAAAGGGDSVSEVLMNA